MEDFRSKKKKNGIGVIVPIAVMCLAIAGVGGAGLFLSSTEEKDYTYQNEQANTSLTEVEKEVENCIEKYFTNAGVEQFISEEDMTEIVKRVSDGIINNYESDTFSYNEENMIRQMIATAVTEAVTNFNQTIENQTLVDQSVVTKEFETYIDETLLPHVTNMIGANSTDVKALKEEMAELKHIYSQGTSSNDAMIKNILNQITTVEREQSSQMDDLSAQMKESEEALKAADDKMNSELKNQINVSSNELQSQINDSSNELQSQINSSSSELHSKIDANQNSTNEEITDIKTELSVRATDAWIDSFSIEASEFVYDGTGFSYTVTNENFKPDSEVLIAYAQGTKITVLEYYQGDGSLTITLKKAPKDAVEITSIHIINR